MNLWTRPICRRRACRGSAHRLSLPRRDAGDRRPAGRADAHRARRPQGRRSRAQQYRRGAGDLPRFGRVPPNGPRTAASTTWPSRRADDQKAADMIVYAPRRVTLAPHEPQAIRIAARPPQGLPDGEYRVHLLFRAIPPATPVVQAAAERARKGPAVPADPGLRSHHPGDRAARQSPGHRRHRQRPSRQKQGRRIPLFLDLSRSGTRSTFGEVRVLKAGRQGSDRAAKGGRGLYRDQ